MPGRRSMPASAWAANPAALQPSRRTGAPSFAKPRVGGDTQFATKTAALSASLVAGAYLMALAVGSSTLPWLAWISLLPLFLAIRVQSPRRALLSGAVWGASLFLFSILAVSTAVPPTWGSLLLLTAVPALYASLGSLYTRWSAGFDPLALGLGWIGVEFALRPLGLHNGLLTGTLGGGLLVNLVGNMLGYAFVAFLVALVNASLVSLLSAIRVRIPRQPYQAQPDDGETRLVSQTLCYRSLIPVHPARPRAPPGRANTRSDDDKTGVRGAPCLRAASAFARVEASHGECLQ